MEEKALIAPWPPRVLRALRLALAAAAALVAFETRSEEPGRILEAKDVQQLRVEESRALGKTSLRLRGLVFHSALGVERTTTETGDGTLRVLVHLALARPGVSGNLDVEVEVPDSVERVTFGRGEAVVWRRGGRPPG